MKLLRLGRIFSFVLLVSMVAPLPAQELPKDYQEVLTHLGRAGDFKANVLKINIPRNDLHVTIAGQPTPTPFGFGGWVTMTKGDGGTDSLWVAMISISKSTALPSTLVWASILGLPLQGTNRTPRSLATSPCARAKSIRF